MAEQAEQEAAQEQLATSSDPLKWGDSLDLLSEGRKQDLAQRLWAWKPGMATEEKPGPFAAEWRDETERLNGLEVFWLAICATVGKKRNPKTLIEAEQRIRAAQSDFFVRFSFESAGLLLQGANLDGAYLERAALRSAHLERAALAGAHLEGAVLVGAHLEGADLETAHLAKTISTGAHLEGAILDEADLEGALFDEAHLEEAILSEAHLERVSFAGTHLEESYLGEAHLERANLLGAHLEDADLTGAYLEGANLSQASMDKATNLARATLTDVRLDGVIFDNTNLSVVDWSLVPRLQDERIAHQARYPENYRDEDKRGKDKSIEVRRDEYQAAARAYRRLAVALQANGMSEEAAGYAYRAQVMQRCVYRFSGWRSWGRWLFSGFLDLLAGYGYKPVRSLIAYIAIISGFMGLYLLNSHFATPHLSWDEALVLSVSSFHGRGFFTQNITLGDTYARLAAFEAVLGLLIEISFIATFTQRFFGSK